MVIITQVIPHCNNADGCTCECRCGEDGVVRTTRCIESQDCPRKEKETEVEAIADVPDGAVVDEKKKKKYCEYRGRYYARNFVSHLKKK